MVGSGPHMGILLFWSHFGVAIMGFEVRVGLIQGRLGVDLVCILILEALESEGSFMKF